MVRFTELHVGQIKSMKDTSKNMPRKFAFFVDALRYSFNMARLQTEEIERALEIIESKIKEGITEDIVFPVIMNSWGVVDSGHRIRELIQQVPGLKKNSPEVQIFLRATEKVKELRDYVQHLRTGIDALPEKTTPLWGVISWVSKKSDDTCFTFMSGTAYPDVSVYSCSYDTWNKKFAHKNILSVNDITVDLEDVSKRINDLDIFIKKWATEEGYVYENKKLSLFRFMVPGHLA